LIGTGHVFRCLALAEALAARDVTVTFLCRDLAGNVMELVQQAGVSLLQLPRPMHQAGASSPWFGGVDWETDLLETAKAIAARKPVADWLIVDHYGIDHRWESSLRPYVGRIAVIDDLADRVHDCDLLLDANLQAASGERYRSLVPPHAVVLSGPRYALLRPQFKQARALLRPRSGEVKRILVFFGGTDISNETQKALDALGVIRRPEISVDVVVGGTNPYRVSIAAWCSRRKNVRFHCQVANMAELMVAADLFIGSGGTSAWERCAVGLPGLAMTVAENQEPAMRRMAEEVRLLYLGRAQDVSAESIARAVEGLLALPELVAILAGRSASLVDGKGAERMARYLQLPAIQLRRARAGDCKSIYHWRNAEETRRHSFDPSEMSFAAHESWFQTALAATDRILLIGEARGEPIGVIRYDLSEDHAGVSVYLVPGKHGQGYGAQLLRTGSEWLRQAHPEIREIRAEILGANLASQTAFRQAGYEPHSGTYKKLLR
jgi:UDP-2,4-diacetamido-2,4,6-trideoxy-beta-L-altropyranose hydrolase